jgi:excisionase family DNA binding protein
MTDCRGDAEPMTGSSTTAAPRFVRLKDVAEVLNISTTQVYALLRSGELSAIKVGGRGQWRIEVSVLEEFIQRMYAETKTFVETHPFGTTGSDGLED